MKEIKWKRMMFKEHKVYVEVDEEGKVVTQGGMAVIKYQLDQEMEYKVRASSITEIDETPLRKMKAGKKEPKNALEKTPLSVVENYADTITIFTDGACAGNPGPAAIGVFLQYRSHKKEISQFIGRGTNNIAELTAIKVALQEIKDPRLPVVLYTDSAYCYGVLRGSWKAKKNLALIETTKKEMARFPKLSILKVKGHKGIEGNETANRLASQALHERNISNPGNAEMI